MAINLNRTAAQLAELGEGLELTQAYWQDLGILADIGLTFELGVDDFSLIAGAESVGAVLAEFANPPFQVGVTDTLRVSGLDLDSALFPLVTGPGTFRVGLIESGVVVDLTGAAPTPIVATDSEPVELTEAQISLVASSLAEALVAALTEAQSSALASTRAESLTAGLTEAQSSALTASAADALLVALSEAQDSRLASSVAEALGVLLSEAASVVISSILSSSDTLAVGLTESPSSLLAVSLAESLVAALTEAQSSALATSAAETILAALAEGQSSLLAASVADALAVALLEAAAIVDITGVATPIAGAEAIASALLEATTNAVASSSLETVALGVVDDQASALSTRSADVLAIAESESAAVVVATMIAAADSLAVGIDEPALFPRTVGPLTFVVGLLESASVEIFGPSAPPAAAAPFVMEPGSPEMTWISEPLEPVALRHRPPIYQPRRTEPATIDAPLVIRAIAVSDAIGCTLGDDATREISEWAVRPIVAADQTAIGATTTVFGRITFDWDEELRAQDGELVEVLL